MNPFEIAISILVGIATGLIAGKIYANTTAKKNRKKLNVKYKPIEGSYIRWYKENKEKGLGQIHAKAHLNHCDGENRLDIKVETYVSGLDVFTISQEEWTGEIVMDTIRSGTIIWEQSKPINGNNGFKRILVGKNLDEITLVGEAESGFGIERFTEKETMKTNNDK